MTRKSNMPSKWESVTYKKTLARTGAWVKTHGSHTMTLKEAVRTSSTMNYKVASFFIPNEIEMVCFVDKIPDVIYCINWRK